MPEIVALLQNIAPVVYPAVLKEMSQVIYGLLISQSRITMLELSRWIGVPRKPQNISSG